MVLANRAKLQNSRSLVRVFGGLNETYACSEAEYSAGVNFSARDFPALSTRKPRRKLRELTGLNGMYHLNGLLTVCGKDLIYTPDADGANPVTCTEAVTDGKKALVGIGTKILIFPDKVAFDTADGSVSALGAVWQAEGQSVQFAPCDAAGKAYEVSGYGKEEPEKPADGQLFLKVEDEEHPWASTSTLEEYSASSGSWTAVPLEYCRITAAGAQKLFAQWDTVTVQGTAAQQAGMWTKLDGDLVVYDVLENGLRVRVNPEGDHVYGTLVQSAESAQWTSLDGKETRSFAVSTPVRMERRVPDLDYVTECDNRVWGCSSKENVIYACRLGDPTNWFSYRGIAADSYAVTVGSDGAFTGAATCMGYALFFKENTLHKLYGSKPSDFQLTSLRCRGVAKNAARSLCAERDALLSFAGRCDGMGRQHSNKSVRRVGFGPTGQCAERGGQCAGWPLLPACGPHGGRRKYGKAAGVRYRARALERRRRVLLRDDQHRRTALSVGRAGTVGRRSQPRSGLAGHRRCGGKAEL